MVIEESTQMLLCLLTEISNNNGEEDENRENETNSKKRDVLQLKKRAKVIVIHFHLDGRAEYSEERDRVLM